MCGFVVFLTSTGGLEPRFRAPEPWLEMVRHRGPDAQASLVEGGAAMHFARLSILDLSPAGMQPMRSSCGRWVAAFNGEIANFRELAESHALSTRGRSDTEVLLEMVRRYGPDAATRLRGMFSCVIYDTKERSAFALRDPFGIKPLYYAQEGGTLVLASEIRPILRALNDPSIDEAAVARFLRRGEIDDGEGTLYRKVRQLPPGHRLLWKTGEVRVEPYLKPLPAQAEPQDEEAERSAHDQLMRRVVGQYLQSDVPVGVSLSGGFDSSFLAHLVRANLPAERCPLMFTRGYLNFEGNEFDAAQRVADRFHFHVRPVTLSPAEVPEMLRSCSLSQEHPVTSLSVLAFHKLYRAARRDGITVLLEGQGGDEIWAGYSYYADAQAAGRSHDGSSFRLNDDLLGAERTPAHGPAVNGLPAPANILFPEPSPLLARQLGDIYGAKLQRALRFVDRASMESHVEVRVPYLDERIAFAALRLPDGWKVRGGEMRSFARRLADPYLGEAIAHRPKVAVQDPQRKWFQSDLRGYIEDLLGSSHLFISRFLDPAALRRLYGEFLRNPAGFDNLTFLAFPLFVEEWHRAMSPTLHTPCITSST